MFELDIEMLKEQGLQLVDSAKKTAQDLADKGKNKLDLLNQQARLSKAQRQLGALVYSLHKAGEENPALTEELPEDAALCLYAGLREEYADSRDARCLATRDIRLARRLVRDCLFRGHGAAFTLGLWGHVCAGEDRYIKPYKPRANLLLDTTHTYEVCLWRTVLDAMPADPALTATQARQLAALREKFAAFPALGTELVPQNSMLREFIGK